MQPFFNEDMFILSAILSLLDWVSNVIDVWKTVFCRKIVCFIKEPQIVHIKLSVRSFENPGFGTSVILTTDGHIFCAQQ